MAKRPPEKYEPGELDKVRSKLGEISPEEARRMAEVLGGEVGVERDPGAPQAKPAHSPASRKEGKGAPVRGRWGRVDVAEGPAKRRVRGRAPAERESVERKVAYVERLRMDRLCAQPEYQIKTPSSVIASFFSFLVDPPDLVSPDFTLGRLEEVYARLEGLVLAARQLAKMRQAGQAERFRAARPFDHAVLSAIRDWNLEAISAEIARLQQNARACKVEEYRPLLRALYGPWMRLSGLSLALHLRSALNAAFRAQREGDAATAEEQLGPKLRAAVEGLDFAFAELPRLFYPLLLKQVSDRYVPYEAFFQEKRRAILAFLGMSEVDVIAPARRVEEAPEARGAPRVEDEMPLVSEEAEGEGAADKGACGEPPERVRMALATLEGLFPGAGWDRLPAGPDLFPYFRGVLALPPGFALVHPRDPMQLVTVLCLAIKEMLYGFRSISLGAGSDKRGESLDFQAAVDGIIDRWHVHEERVTRHYLGSLMGYCRMIEISPDTRASPFAKRVEAELFELRRRWFLPRLKTRALLSAKASAASREEPGLHEDAATLALVLRQVGKDIDRAIRDGREQAAGGALPSCGTIDNPWERFSFEVPNPVSKRLVLLSGGEKNASRQTNAALVFYALAAVTVLDYLVNDESSWAYTEGAEVLFRSVRGEGEEPLYGVDDTVDADALFRQSLARRGEGQK